MTQLNVGVNALFLALGRYGGVETYMRSVMEELPALSASVDYQLFCPRQTQGTWGSSARVHEVPCALPAVSNRKLRWMARLGYEYGILPARVLRHGCRVLFSPCYTAPVWPGYRSVVTIHDLQQEDLPEMFPAGDRIVFLKLLRQAVRTATHILTVSEFTKQRIVSHYGIPPERITVSYHAASPIYFRRLSREAIDRVQGRYGIHAPYFLSVATLHPHKNLDTLINAVSALRASGEDVSLVLVGLPGLATEALGAKIRAMQAHDYINLTGFVPDEELPALYQGAIAYVLPSLYEGFGIPLLEAMASGVPVVSSNVTALPEIAGDAALLFDPGDRAALVTALRRMLSDADLRASLIARGAERVRTFSWKKTAEVTLAVLEQAAAGR